MQCHISMGWATGKLVPGASLVNGANLRRFARYLDRMREHGLASKVRLIIGPTGESSVSSTPEGGDVGMISLLRAKSRPTADLGQDLPTDISITDFANIPLSAQVQPTLPASGYWCAT